MYGYMDVWMYKGAIGAPASIGWEFLHWRLLETLGKPLELVGVGVNVGNRQMENRKMHYTYIYVHAGGGFLPESFPGGLG